MVERWRNAPVWALSVITGALFAVGMGLFSLTQGDSWGGAAIGAGIAGILFGAVMGPYAARARKVAQAAVGGQRDALTLASRSLRRRGPEPRNEDERFARVQLARHRLQVLDGQRVWGTVLFVGISLLSAWFALTKSPWWWLEVVFFVVVLAVTWQQRRRLRRIVAADD